MLFRYNHHLIVAIGLIITLMTAGLLSAETKDRKNSTHPLVIAIDSTFYPMSFVDEEDNPTGLIVDVWKLWSQKTGIPIEFKAREWFETIDFVRQGKADIHSGLYINEERSRWLSFSRPFYGIGTSIFYRAQQKVIHNLKDLEGSLVGAQKGTYQAAYLRENGFNVLELDSNEQLIQATRKGAIAAFIAEASTTLIQLDRLALSGGIEASETILFNNTFHAGVPKSRAHLIETINKGFQSISAKEFSDIERNWISYPGFRYFNHASDGLGSIKLTDDERRFLLQHSVIKVGGDPYWPPFDFVDINGAVQGLSVDYLDLVSHKLGIRFDFISDKNWSKTLDNFKIRELDMVRAMMSNAEREKYSLFSQPYAEAMVAIFARTDSDITNIEQLVNKTVAIEKNYFTHEALSKNYPDMSLKIVGSTLEALQAVSQGQADAHIGTLAVGQFLIEKHFISNLQVVSRPPIPSPSLKFAVRHDWPLLKTSIDKALASISPTEHMALRQRWMLQSSPIESANQLTEREVTWLLNHQSIRFTGDPDWLPFEGFDSAGNYSGIAAEVIKRLEHETGLIFHRIPSPNWLEAVDMAVKSEVDVLSDDLSNAALKNTHTFTHAYLERPLAIVMHSRQEDIIPELYNIRDKRIGVVNGYGYLWALINQYPDMAFDTQSKTIENALQRVSSGALDALIVTFTAGSYQINQLGINNLRIVGTLPVNMKLGLAVRSDWPELVSILNKAIQRITPAQKNRIVDKWMEEKYIERVDYQLVWNIVIIAGLSLLVISFWGLTIHRQRNRLRHSEERFQLAMNAASDGIWDWDIPTGTVYFSPGYMTMLGYQPDELSQHYSTWKALLHPDDRDDIIARSECAIKNASEHYELEFRLKHKNGSYRSILSRGGIVKISYAGQVIRAVGTNIDVTESKKIQDDLHQAKLEAEKANKFKSQFLANMSHEIRTPLNAVIGMSFLALQTELDRQQRNYIQNIQSASHSLLGVINDILDFSKIEAGKLMIEQTEFGLDSIFENLGNIHSLLASSKNIELIFKIEKSIPKLLYGDPLRLEQVLTNLISARL